MSRRTRERRLEAEERWPTLTQFLRAYLGEDYVLIHGSADGAIAAAIRDCPVERRQTVLSEWRDWNSSIGWKGEINAFLFDGFGVHVPFKTALDARQFMNKVYDSVLASVKEAYQKDVRT